MENPYAVKYLNRSFYSDIFLYTSIFNEIYIAKTYNNIFPTFPKYCLFGLDYSEVIYENKNLNTIQNLIPKQIEKTYFLLENGI